MQRMSQQFYRAKQFLQDHQRAVSAFALLSGFVIDSLTLQRIDLLFETIVLSWYIFLIAGVIFYLARFELQQYQSKFARWTQLVAPFILQYALGGIFSGLSIFYVRSATFSTSWPFLFILFVILLGNEIFSRQLVRSKVLQMSVFFVALFSMIIFEVPILVKQIGPWVFMLSGAMSLLLIFGFYFLLEKFAFNEVAIKSKNKIFTSIALLYMAITIAYFANIIPPIPLSLKEMRVAYDVSRTNGDYVLTVPPPKWWRNFVPIRTTVPVIQGQPVYVYAAVFAPTELEATIMHRWQKQVDGKWVTMSTVPFSITGGRDGGYRGYTLSNQVTEGLWRVDVLTNTQQVVGRKVFRAEYVSSGLDTAVIQR